MGKNINLDERIIFALDVNNIKDVEYWLEILKNEVKFFKIGLELFVSCGFEVVDRVLNMGCEVMLDLKLYDIPETIYRTVKQLSKRNITFLTVHGNYDILKAAVDGASSTPLKILGVTVLTSLDQKDLKQMGYPMAPESLVLKRAELAKKAGCGGVVASAMEAKCIREKLGEDIIIITPGIRLKNSVRDDQKRVLTPQDAIINGADYLVVGRPIRDAKEPIWVVKEIKKEIQSPLYETKK